MGGAEKLVFEPTVCFPDYSRTSFFTFASIQTHSDWTCFLPPFCSHNFKESFPGPYGTHRTLFKKQDECHQ
jgi:hypothetical protein